MSKARVALWLFLILLLASGLRFYQLGFQSLWIDEISTMIGSGPYQSLEMVIDYSSRDQPPLFFLLLHGWVSLFSFNDISGRVLAVCIGLLGVATMYFMGREAKDDRTGLYAALLTAINYIHIFFSQEIRFYGLLFLLSALSYLFYLRALRKMRPLDFMTYAVVTILLLYSHYYGLIVIASQGILFLIWVAVYNRSRKFITLAVASGILIVLSAIPWVPAFLSDKRAGNFWLTQEPFYFPFRYFYIYFKDYASAIVFGLVILFFGYQTFIKWREGNQIKIELILVGSVFFGYLVPFVYSLVKMPMLHVRYTLIVLPSLIVIISIGIGYLTAPWQKTVLITVVITSILSLIWIEDFYTRPYKEDWRGLVATVIAEAGDQDVLVGTNAWYCNYYFRQMQSPHKAIVPEKFNFTSRPPRVWWLDGFNLKPEKAPWELELIESGYVPIRTDSLYHARATLYQLEEKVQ